MKNSCFVAPIHVGKHMDRGIEFIQSYNNHFDDRDLFIVFTNKDEKDLFESKTEHLRYQSIVCTEKLLGSKPITQKKLFGARWVFNNTDFDYVAVIDVDSKFIMNKDYDALFKQQVNEKVYTASKVVNRGINDMIGNRTAREFFIQEDYEKIKRITDNFHSYIWFNDVPVYDRERFYAFLEYIDYDNPNVRSKLTYESFDFILFFYYLITQDDCRIEIINVDNTHAPQGDRGSFLESQTRIDPVFFKKAFAKYKPMWIKKLIDQKLMDNVFMLMHTDRK